MFIQRIITLFLIFTCTFTYATENDSVQSKKELSAHHYVSHCITGGMLNHLNNYLMKLAMSPAGLSACKRKSMIKKLKPEDMIQLCTILSAYVTALTTALYITYKMPQWTDTYILKKKTKRSTKQNILVFFDRIITCPSYPGMVMGEYFSHQIFEPVYEKIEQPSAPSLETAS